MATDDNSSNGGSDERSGRNLTNAELQALESMIGQHRQHGRVMLENISVERKEILRKLSELSFEDLKAIEKLVERHDDIIKMLKKDEAWGIVFTTIKTSILWISVVVGGIYMGLDKFTAFIKGLLV